jgi:hypothetical protein
MIPIWYLCKTAKRHAGRWVQSSNQASEHGKRKDHINGKVLLK